MSLWISKRICSGVAADEYRDGFFAGRHAAAEQIGEAPERLGRLGLRSGDDDRDPLVHCARNLAV